MTDQTPPSILVDKSASPLKPFFPYFGSKWRLAKLYGAPRGAPVVIEPFAGSAGYSLYWGIQKAELYDLDPIICGIWDYLIKVKPNEVLKLPDLKAGQSVDEVKVPVEARNLVGFWLNRGNSTPRKTMSAFSARTEKGQLVWGQRARERIAAQIDRIRGWTIQQRSWQNLPVTLAPSDAFWFVDPPYQDKGRFYKCGAQGIDFKALGVWCRTLPGHGVVCEGPGATWLPFTPFKNAKSTKGKAMEYVWRFCRSAGARAGSSRPR